MTSELNRALLARMIISSLYANAFSGIKHNVDDLRSYLSRTDRNPKEMMMSEYSEKRQFKRFEIPGAKGNYKKMSLTASFRGFSKPYPVMNVSVGGVALLCEEEFKKGEEVMIKLTSPGEEPLELMAKMIWQKKVTFDIDTMVGFEFLPFGSSKGSNPPELLNTLRRLYARYT